MALLDKVRRSLFLTSTVTDEVLQGLIDTALDQMRHVGIREELLQEDTMNPTVEHAVIAYCHAFYHVDSIQSPVFLQSFKSSVTSLMNSDRSDYLYEEPAGDGSDDGDGD